MQWPQEKRSDLTPGLAAGICLAVMILVLNLPFLLAFLLAVGIYFGVLLLMPTPKTPVSAPSEPAMLAELEALAARITLPGVASHIRKVSAGARRILEYLEQNEADADSWREYLRECLHSTLEATRRFVRLARHIHDPQHHSVVQYLEYVDTMSAALQNVHAKLIDADAADFTHHIKSFKTTLDEINQVYLGEERPE